jgi:hypothetical protein
MEVVRTTVIKEPVSLQSTPGLLKQGVEKQGVEKHSF